MLPLVGSGRLARSAIKHPATVAPPQIPVGASFSVHSHCQPTPACKLLSRTHILWDTHSLGLRAHRGTTTALCLAFSVPERSQVPDKLKSLRFGSRCTSSFFAQSTLPPSPPRPHDAFAVFEGGAMPCCMLRMCGLHVWWEMNKDLLSSKSFEEASSPVSRLHLIRCPSHPTRNSL
jgi:hypothetical protein